MCFSKNLRITSGFRNSLGVSVLFLLSLSTLNGQTMGSASAATTEHEANKVGGSIIHDGLAGSKSPTLVAMPPVLNHCNIAKAIMEKGHIKSIGKSLGESKPNTNLAMESKPNEQARQVEGLSHDTEIKLNRAPISSIKKWMREDFSKEASIGVSKELPFGQWTAVTIAETQLYSSNSANSKILKSVPEGTKVAVLEEIPQKSWGTDWVKVQYKGETGWLHIFVNKVHDLSTLPAPESVNVEKGGRIMVIVTPGTIARLSPIPDSAPQNREILRIPKGTRLLVKEGQVYEYDFSELRLSPAQLAAMPHSITYYKVTYRGKTGWVCESDFESK